MNAAMKEAAIQFLAVYYDEVYDGPETQRPDYIQVLEDAVEDTYRGNLRDQREAMEADIWKAAKARKVGA